MQVCTTICLVLLSSSALVMSAEDVDFMHVPFLNTLSRFLYRKMILLFPAHIELGDHLPLAKNITLDHLPKFTLLKEPRFTEHDGFGDLSLDWRISLLKINCDMFLKDGSSKSISVKLKPMKVATKVAVLPGNAKGATPLFHFSSTTDLSDSMEMFRLTSFEFEDWQGVSKKQDEEGEEEEVKEVSESDVEYDEHLDNVLKRLVKERLAKATAQFLYEEFRFPLEILGDATQILDKIKMKHDE